LLVSKDLIPEIWKRIINPGRNSTEREGSIDWIHGPERTRQGIANQKSEIRGDKEIQNILG